MSVKWRSKKIPKAIVNIINISNFKKLEKHILLFLMCSFELWTKKKLYNCLKKGDIGIYFRLNFSKKIIKNPQEYSLKQNISKFY
ncbi:hypothetical protein BOW57_17930 [Flavobacterium sp. YO64]|nr:hypothetical protein BOW57_17930 [Flavobacterium sp. YO64]